MTTFNNPMDFYNYTTKVYNAIPKSSDDLKDVLEKIQDVVKTESTNCKDVLQTYAKASKGEATANEISKANKQAAELVKTAAFASMLVLPGAIFAMPLIIEKAKEYNIDLVPVSVASQFDI